MDELSQHLRSTFHRQSRQIETIYRLVGEVIPVFQTFFSEHQHAWPYEVSKRADPVIEGFSISTNAMISFALASILGNVETSILLPALRRRPDFHTITGQANLDRTRVESIGRSSAKELSARISNAQTIDGKEFLVRSGTYGLDDPFTLVWLAELLRANALPAGDRDQLELAAHRVISRKDQFLEWPSEDVSAVVGKRRALDHAFVRLRVIQLIRSLGLEDGGSKEAANRCAEGLLQRLEQHLAYYSVRDGRFDPAELTFCLEGLLIHDPDGVGRTIIERVLTVIGECQNTNPYWRPLTPFIGSERGMALFPISVEVANSLLRICKHLDGDTLHDSYFDQSAAHLERYFSWLQARIIRNETPSHKGFVGWHSEHVAEPGTIHLWETSQVVLFLVHYAALLQEQAARSSLVVSQFSVKEFARERSKNGNSTADMTAADYWRIELLPVWMTLG